MNSTNRLRIPALSCALTFLLCELISRPFTEMGVCDDWSYIRSAQILAQTGHIVYNAWGAPILGWQLYLAAASIKLFGFSFTAARIPALLLATVAVFLMQRIFVRIGTTERNASIGTLSVALAPLYMLLAPTFMTDMFGMFAIVICLYSCVRALQAATPGSATAWICFAVLTNGIAGSSRQTAWLGILVIVPCTLWLLRRVRGVLTIGVVAWLAGVAFVMFVLHWFQQQPYSLPEHLFVPVAGLEGHMVRELARALLEMPFLMLAVMAAFLPELRRGGLRLWAAIAVIGGGYAVLAIHTARQIGADAVLQPLLPDWIGFEGYVDIVLASNPPLVLTTGIRVVLTALSILVLLCVLAFLVRLRTRTARAEAEAAQPAWPADTPRLDWRQIGWLLGPFALATFGLMIPRSTAVLFDRYLLPLTLVAALCLLRAYQQFVGPRLPAVAVAIMVIVALYSIGSTHDMFAFDRARVAVSNEMQAGGAPDVALDGGLDYNGWVELQHSAFINEKTLINPPGSYVPLDPYRGWTCIHNDPVFDWFPHIDPRYGIAYRPDACHGPAPFAPVNYFRWLGMRTSTLYVVNYGPRTPERP